MVFQGAISSLCRKLYEFAFYTIHHIFCKYQIIFKCDIHFYLPINKYFGYKYEFRKIRRERHNKIYLALYLSLYKNLLKRKFL